nr:type 1 glutamine amidotransferase family protein [uncultured Clostridium sp.]
MNNTVYLYVFDTMSDWEIGYLTAELNSGRYYKKGLAPSKIVTVGIEKTPVTTMGGLKILPDIKLDECSIESIDALILPGGNTWTETVNQPILKIAQRCLKEGILVAAICGATMGLAQTGLLNSHWHTSNDLEYLKMICPAYAGEKYYKMEPVVTDGKLITASGIAPLEFSFHVLKSLGVFSSKTLDAWYSLNKTHESRYFYELMDSIQVRQVLKTPAGA